MAARHFENANLAESSENLLFSINLMRGYAAPLRLARVYQSSGARPMAGTQQGAIADVYALARGVCWAFAIEGGAALLIGAGWHLLRLLLQ